MRRLTLSCTNVSFIPRSFAPPQPKHLFVGFGARVIVSVKFSQPLSAFSVTSLLLYFVSSNQRNSTPLSAPHAALALAHFNAEDIRENRHAARDFFFIQASVAETKGVGQRILHVEVATGSKEHSALFRVDQEFACVKARRKFQPQAHSAVRTRP